MTQTTARTVEDLPVLAEMDDPAWGADFSWVLNDLFTRDYQGILRTSTNDLVVYTHRDLTAFKTHPAVSHQTLAAQIEHFRPPNPEDDFGLERWSGQASFSFRAPEHAPAKQLQVRTMTPRAVAAFAGGFREVVQELIDELAERDEIDFPREFVRPAIKGFWKKVIGISEEEAELAVGLTPDCMGLFNLDPTEDHKVGANRATAAWMEHVPAWLKRAQESGDYPFVADVLPFYDTLDPATRPGDPWNLLATTIFDGFHTMSVHLSGMVYAMIEGGVQPAGHAGDMKFATAVFNEGARMHSGFTFLARQATEDFEYDGVLIPRDTNIMMMWLFGNRDPEVFEDPLTYKLDRANVGDILTFGGGIYVCAGRNLVKAVSEMLVAELANANVTIERTGEVEWLRQSVLHELIKFPVRMTRG